MGRIRNLIKRKNRNISARWYFNTIGIFVALLIIVITCISFSIQNYVYNGIQQVLIGRSDELLNIFSSSSYSNFSTVSRAYVENFPDKNDMEIMSISSEGDVVITSTGFAPDQNQVMPDYISALSSKDNFASWVGTLETGEKVMAITQVVRNEHGTVEGSLRYLVSLTKADEQVAYLIFLLILVAVCFTLIIVLSGVYFIRSILVPVKQINSSAIRISNGDFDVRIQKTHEDEIGQLIDTINVMAEELGTSERLKNDFISSISHELRTPLTAIKGWAETMQGGDLDEQTSRQGLSIIVKESQRLTGIVEELLDFSRLQNGRLNLALVKADLLAELDEVIFLFTERVKAENKKLIYDEFIALPPVMVDVNRLKQVFVNIIDNAIKYTHEGGTITVQTKEKDDGVYVIVSDTGCGISGEHLPNIKKKFYKANQVIRGSGIGLAVADEIIGLHSGSLNIESKLGEGTTVTIILPKYNG